jgi:hypothetical protein
MFSLSRNSSIWQPSARRLPITSRIVGRAGNYVRGLFIRPTQSVLAITPTYRDRAKLLGVAVGRLARPACPFGAPFVFSGWFTWFTAGWCTGAPAVGDEPLQNNRREICAWSHDARRYAAAISRCAGLSSQTAATHLPHLASALENHSSRAVVKSQRRGGTARASNEVAPRD